MFPTHLPTSSPGVFYGWFEKRGSSGADAAGGESSDDFLLGSGMSLFPVTLSLTTSFITAIELLGNPAEMFFSGTQFSLIGKWWCRFFSIFVPEEATRERAGKYF